MERNGTDFPAKLSLAAPLQGLHELPSERVSLPLKPTLKTRFRFLIGSLSVVLVMASCTRPNVMVVDPAGAAVEGASVEAISMSVNGGSEMTDRSGAVKIPEGGIQPTEWIRVTKPGYIDSGFIKFRQPKPIRVVLRK